MLFLNRPYLGRSYCLESEMKGAYFEPYLNTEIVMFRMQKPTSPRFSSVFGFVILAMSVWIVGCQGQDGGQDVRKTIRFQDVNRFVHVHVPEGYKPGSKVPLVMAFHGAGDTGGGFQKHSGLDNTADKYGFIVAYPSANGFNWAEGCNCNRPDLDGVDDIGFTDAVLSTLNESYSIDPNRMFAVGFSQGGLFAQRVACERSGTYAAFSTVAAMISEPLSRVCWPAQPVRMMMINGTSDSILPYAGIPSGSFATKSVAETIAMWGDRNECSDQTTTTKIAGNPTYQRDTIGCKQGGQVRLIEIVQGQHEWPRGTPDAPKLLMSFFGLSN